MAYHTCGKHLIDSTNWPCPVCEIEKLQAELADLQYDLSKARGACDMAQVAARRRGERIKLLEAAIAKLRANKHHVLPNADGEGGETWRAFAADLDMQLMRRDAEIAKLRAKTEEAVGIVLCQQTENAKLKAELGDANSRLIMKERAADVMAKVADDWVERGLIDSRSALADARLDYGDPYKYSDDALMKRINELEAEIAKLTVELASSQVQVAYERERNVNNVLQWHEGCEKLTAELGDVRQRANDIRRDRDSALEEIAKLKAELTKQERVVEAYRIRKLEAKAEIVEEVSIDKPHCGNCKIDHIEPENVHDHWSPIEQKTIRFVVWRCRKCTRAVCFADWKENFDHLEEKPCPN